MEEDKIKLPDELIDSIKSLSETIATSHDSAAAMLYRLMFQHERNISVLEPMQTNCLTDYVELEANMMKLITKTICSI